MSKLPAIFRLGRYEVLGRLANGAMAEIFLGRAPGALAGTEQFVVLKRLLPHLVDGPFASMFLDEARVVARLRHPGLSTIHEIGEEDGAHFIAMEWVDGVTSSELATRLGKGRAMPAHLAVRMISQVAEALHAVHVAHDPTGRLLGIIHRDVTPNNIMLSFTGDVKLIDFGVAKTDIQSARTATGMVKGRCAYLAPEQCLEDEITQRSDIFSLGVCLYEAVTGRRLYERRTLIESINAIAHDPVPDPALVAPRMSKTLRAIIMRMLAKNPAHRYRTAHEVHRALEHYLADSTGITTRYDLSRFVRFQFPERFAIGPNLRDTEAPPAEQSLAPDPPRRKRRKTAVTVTEPLRPRVSLRLMVAAMVVLFISALSATSFLLTAKSNEKLASAPAFSRVSSDGIRIESAPMKQTTFRSRRQLPAQTAEPSSNVAPPKPGPAKEVVAGIAEDSSSASTVNQTRPMEPNATPKVGGSEEIHESELEKASAVSPTESSAAMEVKLAPGSDVSIVDDEQVRSTTTISVNSRPWAKIWVDGKFLGNTPVSNVPVEHGRVKIRLVDREGCHYSRRVRSRKDGHKRAFFRLSCPDNQR